MHTGGLGHSGCHEFGAKVFSDNATGDWLESLLKSRAFAPKKRALSVRQPRRLNFNNVDL